MSAAWKWLGAHMPALESMRGINPVGAGTDFPLAWNNTYLSIAPNQICRFEWMCKEVTVVVSGSCTLRILHGGTLSYDDVPVAISFNKAQNRSGSTWDVNEPSDYGPGISSPTAFNIIDSYEVPYHTSWGEDVTIQVLMGYSLGGLMADDASIKPDLLGYSTYYKGQRLTIGVGCTTASPLGGGSLVISTSSDPAIIPVTSPFPVGSANLFHGTTTVYAGDYRSTGDGSVSLSTCEVTRTAEYAAPADIA